MHFLGPDDVSMETKRENKIFDLDAILLKVGIVEKVKIILDLPAPNGIIMFDEGSFSNRSGMNSSGSA